MGWSIVNVPSIVMRKLNWRNPTPVVFAALLLLSGCDDDPSSPSQSRFLEGEWSYTFTTTRELECPVNIPQGCSGSGTLRFERSGDSLEAHHTFRGACQTCGSAFDYASSGRVEDLEVTDTELRFSLDECQLTAPLPDGPVDSIEGDVTCTMDPPPDAEGSWSMTKQM